MFFGFFSSLFVVQTRVKDWEMCGQGLIFFLKKGLKYSVFGSYM